MYTYLFYVTDSTYLTTWTSGLLAGERSQLIPEEVFSQNFFPINRFLFSS